MSCPTLGEAVWDPRSSWRVLSWTDLEEVVSLARSLARAWLRRLC